MTKSWQTNGKANLVGFNKMKSVEIWILKAEGTAVIEDYTQGDNKNQFISDCLF